MGIEQIVEIHAEGDGGGGADRQRSADAQEPLYNSLDENQKRRFAVLSRLGRGGDHGVDRPQWRERFDNWRNRRTDWHNERGTDRDSAPSAGDRI